MKLFLISQKIDILPEGLILHDCGKAAQVLTANDPIVREGEDKVNNDTAPDGYMVPYCPVLSIQCNLDRYIEC